jgi:probable rRNA maturation factor
MGVIQCRIDRVPEIKLRWKRLSRILPSLFQEILKTQFLKPSKVELWLTSGRELRPLNRAFRGKDKSTDVLSFPSEIPGLLGSIVIDLEIAQQQARRYRHSLEREVLELSVHGVFHLMGFDHENRAEAQMMKAYEIYWTKGIKI